MCENDVFNKYIVPFGGISEGASKINGLKKHKDQLELNGSVLHDAFKTPKEGKKDHLLHEKKSPFQNRPEKLKKSRPKKLVKLNKSISRKKMG